MVHIMVTAWWPPHPAKGAEIAKKAYEAAKKFPADESLGTLLVQGFIGDKIGTKSIAIWSVKEGKLEESLTRISDALLLYAEVEGFTSKIDLMRTIEEAWESVGMKPPE